MSNPQNKTLGLSSVQSASAQPASAQPASAQPASAQPASAQPGSAQPASAQPASAHDILSGKIDALLEALAVTDRKWEYNIRFADPSQPLDATLNNMGEAGWELKSHTERPSGMAHIPNQIMLVFGRPKV